MTFLLKVMDNGEAHVPLANVIVAVELLNAMALILNVLPTPTVDGL
jgi:Zn-dependent protease